MYDAIHIGPFTIQFLWIVYFLSFLATYIVLDGLITESNIKQFIKQHFWTVVFILLISYKFSVVLFQPELLITNRWLFLTGGEKGLYLGVCLSIIFLIRQRGKANVLFNQFVLGLVTVSVLFIVIFNLVKFIVLSIL